jgi:hypothetical protein
MVFGILGINIMHGRGFWVADLINSYFLACLFIVSFKSYAGRFGKLLWAVVVFLPIVVSIAGGYIPFLKYFSSTSLLGAGIPLAEKVSDASGQLLVAWIYEYILICAIFCAYDALGRIKTTPGLSGSEKAREQS